MTSTGARQLGLTTRVLMVTVTLATVATLSSCVHANGTGHPTAGSPATPVQVSSAVSTAVAPDSAGRPAIYAAAIAEVNAYLGVWMRHGPIVAAAVYNVPEQQRPTDAASPRAWNGPLFLVSGKVVDYRPYSWVSTSQFTLLVIMDLHFTGADPAVSAWAEGRNGQLVTFSGQNVSSLYRMSWTTGP